MSNNENTKLLEDFQQWLEERKATTNDVIYDDKGWFINVENKEYLPAIFAELYSAVKTF